MYLEGEDAVRFHEYMEREPSEKEIKFMRECHQVMFEMESRENTKITEI
jgi:hypothetical protein